MRIRFWRLLIPILILAACQPATPQASLVTPHPTQVTPIIVSPSTFIRATPISDSPAAGICAEFDTSTVTVEIQPDMPSPRCVIVFVDQKLNLINRTSKLVEVGIADYRINLSPGDNQLLDLDVGDYLEIGVHHLSVIPEGGGNSPELWVKQR